MKEKEMLLKYFIVVNLLKDRSFMHKIYCT